MNAPESRSEFHQFISNVVLKKADKLSGGAHPLLDYSLHLAFYAALTAIFLMIVALIVKLMFNCDEDEEGRREVARRATEHSRLFMPKESAAYTTCYGTSKDIETGSTSSSEDLYDGKICVICYDEKRNCFFVPCGHCIACYTCANRIVKEESRSCPICRGIIDKIRKLHIL